MIYSDDLPVTFDDPLPEAVDVVVIGGGVIGVSTAWFLRQKGLSVLVCDKGRIAGEQSSRNWGWIRQQGRDAAELPIVIESINAWEGLAPEIHNATGEDIGFTRQGVLYTAETEDQMDGLERWMEIAGQHQLDTRLLSSDEVSAMVPGPSGQWVGGLVTPSDGRAEPWKAVPSLARTLQKRGGILRERCAVRSIDVAAGRVSGVVTEAGAVRTQSVVCAGGAWSTLFMANLGINLPQLTVRATVARTAAAPEVYTGNASLSGVAIRRRQDGGYTVASSGTNEHYIGADSFRYFFRYLPALQSSARWVKLRIDGDLVERLSPTRSWRADEASPFEKQRVLNPAPSGRALRKMRAGLRKRVPALEGVAFEEAWAGMIDVTPDVVPVMDEVPQYPGFYLATGFSGHGFGIGPGAGRVMADLVSGDPTPHDLHRFRFGRFWDGSRLEVGPGL